MEIYGSVLRTVLKNIGCIPYVPSVAGRFQKDMFTVQHVVMINIASVGIFVFIGTIFSVTLKWRIIMPSQTNIMDDIFSRIKQIFDVNTLKNKLVTIIGLGTGGSLVAVELAKCSVGWFRLLDFDKLKIHNIIRHACGIRDVGRFKTEAVKESILNINLGAEIETFNVDAVENTEIIDKLIRGSDLLLICTDTELSKYKINEYCVELFHEEKIVIPAIYAGAYERAFGGDVMRVIPGETPCYDCVIGAVQQSTSWESKPQKKIVCGRLESAEDFKAEPGLGMDVHFIALIQAKLALLTLLRGSGSNLEDIPYNYLLWGNRREWIFKEPFKCIFANVTKRKNCPTCSKWESWEENLSMTRSQMKREAKVLIKGLPKANLPAP